MPVVATTSATKVYRGPLLSALQAALPDTKTIERRNMNAWEDDAVRSAILATGRKILIFAGFLMHQRYSYYWVINSQANNCAER